MSNRFHTIVIIVLLIISAEAKAQVPAVSGVKSSAQSKIRNITGAAGQEWQQFRQLFKPGIRFSNLSLEGNSSLNHSLISNNYFTATSLQQYQLKTGLNADIAGIPLQAEFIRRESIPVFTEQVPRNWYKVNVDVDSYKAKLQALAQKLGPEALTRSGSQLKALRESFVQQITNTYKGRATGALRQALDSISGTVNPVDLAGKSPDELKNLFFGMDLEGIQADLQRKISEAAESRLDEVKKDSLLTGLQAQLGDVETKMEYLKKVGGLIEKAQSTGMLTALKDLDGKASEEYQALLANPTELAKRVAEKFNFSGIEKIISLLSQFKLGGQTLPLTDNFNLPLLSRGISFDLNIGDKLIGFATGKMLPVVSNLQLPGMLPGQPDSAANKSTYWFLHFRKGLAENNHKGVKLTNISSRGANSIDYTATDFAKKNTRIIQLYSKERIAGNNWLQAEISKSITSSPEAGIRGLNGGRDKLLDELFSFNNVSLKLKTEGTVEKAGISHQLFFTKNIGTPFPVTGNYFSTGGYESGFMFRMRQKQKKLSVYARGTIRSFNTPGVDGSKWKNTDIRASISYRLKKGRKLQLSPVWHDGYKRYFLSGTPLTVRQQSSGITADMNLVNPRLFGLYNTSFISAGIQRDIFPMANLIPGKNQSVSTSYNFMLNQAFLYGNHVLQFNAYYTKVTQDIDAFLYNTRLDVDAGGQFRINRNITAGFSLVYGYFKGAYTNVGVRPSLSGLLLKNLSVDINADIRKNITLVNPLFSQFTNVNCGFRYTIK